MKAGSRQTSRGLGSPTAFTTLHHNVFPNLQTPSCLHWCGRGPGKADKIVIEDSKKTRVGFILISVGLDEFWSCVKSGN